MSRKKFLATSGIMALSLIGVTGALNKLTDLDLTRQKSSKTTGFGSSTYGGKENR